MNRALVYHGKGDVRLESLPDPTPPDGRGVVVRVQHTAICGSDLHLYHGTLPVPPGYTLGHEFIGEIVETGRDVRSFKSGDRVLVSGVIGCGECRACAGGHPSRWPKVIVTAPDRRTAVRASAERAPTAIPCSERSSTSTA